GSRPRERPALLTRISSPPSAASAASTKLRQLSGSVTSRLPSRREPVKTVAPASRSALVVAAPIPLDAPVTIARFPSSPATARTLPATISPVARLSSGAHAADPPGPRSEPPRRGRRARAARAARGRRACEPQRLRAHVAVRPGAGVRQLGDERL